MLQSVKINTYFLAKSIICLIFATSKQLLIKNRRLNMYLFIFILVCIGIMFADEYVNNRKFRKNLNRFIRNVKEED